MPSLFKRSNGVYYIAFNVDGKRRWKSTGKTERHLAISKEAGEYSKTIRGRVIFAREIQMKRFEGRKGMYCNADLTSKDIIAYCKLDNAGEELLKMAITKLGLSARAYDRILKVARTIADLSSSDSIRPEHISEAIQYRSLDRNLWQS